MESKIDQELSSLEAQYGFTRPDRGDLDDPSIQWREGKPDYRRADLLYYQGKTKNHSIGSLEMTVENLVKELEMEFRHKSSPKQWRAVKHEVFQAQINGGKEVSAQCVARVGIYNLMLANISKDLYDADKESFDSSHHLFQEAFLEGFAWEVLEVYTGPPRVAFSWRHWGNFDGEFKGVKGAGQMIEMHGFLIATVDSNLKILKIEVFTKLEGFLQALLEQVTPEEEVRGDKLVEIGCPIHKQNKT